MTVPPPLKSAGEDDPRRELEQDSPLASVTATQVRAHNFLLRRNAAAITENEVDMAFSPLQRENSWLSLGFIAVVLFGIGCVALAVFRPVGRVADAQIVADADNHAIYVLVDGTARPAWNLVSAQLVAGQPMMPATVKHSVIESYPTGPRVGIVDAPQAFTVKGGGSSDWALCDTAPAASSDPSPMVTALAGRLTLGQRADALAADTAVLAEHAGSMYVVWAGKRSRVDLANRPLALALGIDSTAVAPVRMSKALFDAIPATEALTTPPIPQVGEPSRWQLPAGAVIGSVVKVSGVTGGSEELYVVLADGLQPVEPFVASLLMSTSPAGQVDPIPVSPKVVSSIPAVSSLRVDYYPPRRLRLVDTKAYPVVCVGWSKGATDREAVTTVISGKGLPIPLSAESSIVPLVRNDRRPNSVEANQVWIDPSAPNLVVATGVGKDAVSRESLWWLSPQGVRYGISQDSDTLRALGLEQRVRTDAVQVPWPLLAVYASGSELSRKAALVQADSVTAPPVLSEVKPQ
ncbi:type VII secretion protein EccB [Mycolicibacterium mageritense]|uniref:type VII secretion protein EccB n=1 Tax=Mycolicibacterium mageritense TaxID=53462 RepID=UPI0011DA3A51|nr:type VII secretion protein EccB [Mycolicibacterium mageritense]TXI55751.1 MAG: type VII secretion protein EccB [Mycolicibacterium mageritense]